MLAIAVFSNFIAIAFFISIWGGLILIQLVNHTSKNGSRITRKKILQHLIPTGISLGLFLLLVRPMLFLLDKGEFAYGSSSLSDTFLMLMKDSLYGQSYFSGNTPAIMLAAYAILIALSFFTAAWVWKKKKESPAGRLFLGVIIIFVVLHLFLITSNLLLDAKYFVHRKSLIYYPLSGLIFYLFMVQVDSIWPKLSKILPSIFLVLCLFHFVRCFNTNSCREWSYDMYTKEVALLLDQRSPKDQKLSFGVNWLFHPTMQFYIESRDLNLELPLYQKTIQLDTSLSYYYVMHYDRSLVADYYREEKKYEFRYLMQKE
jgi:hypothetical protein